MNYLVLGSSGLIGAHLCERIRQSGDTVFTFDIIASPQEDLRTPSAKLRSLMSASDFVFLTAYDVGGSPYLASQQNQFEFISNNIRIMETVFSILHETKVPFIFTSSQMAQYNFSSYGTLKRIGEFYTQSLGGLCVRLWNVYGYESRPDRYHVVVDFIHKASSEGEIRMLTNGDEERQFLYVDDCAEGLSILSKPEIYSVARQSCTFDMSQFEWTKIIDVAQMIGDEFDVPVIASDKLDSVHNCVKLNPGMAITHYWKPKTPLREGIRRVIATYKAKELSRQCPARVARQPTSPAAM